MSQLGRAGGSFYRDDRGWLWHRDVPHEAVMTDLPLEHEANRPLWDNARGRVLICGLGIGFVLPRLLENPAVASITIVEREQEVIDLMLADPAGRALLAEHRIQIVKADVFDWVPDTIYDTIWIDLFTTREESQRRGAAANYSSLRDRLAQFLRPGGWISLWSVPQ